jgi:hypothetical protein
METEPVIVSNRSSYQSEPSSIRRSLRSQNHTTQQRIATSCKISFFFLNREFLIDSI